MIVRVTHTKESTRPILGKVVEVYGIAINQMPPVSTLVGLQPSGEEYKRNDMVTPMQDPDGMGILFAQPVPAASVPPGSRLWGRMQSMLLEVEIQRISREVDYAEQSLERAIPEEKDVHRDKRDLYERIRSMLISMRRPLED